MKRTLTEWRRALSAGCVALAFAGVPSPTFGQAADSGAADQQVDPAKKQLTAANGLFTRGLFKLAAQEYADFLEKYPTHADATTARYALAVSQYRLREYDKAAEQLYRVVADNKFEQRDEALAVLGHCELSQKHYDQANAAFDELLNRYPTSKQVELAQLNRAQVQYLAGKFPEAAKGCQAYLDKYPSGASRPEALYFLGLSQHQQKQDDLAVQTLQQLTQKFPDSPHQVDALLVTGQALEAQQKAEPAIETYRQMVTIAPETRKPDAHYSLGLALYKAGKFDESARELTTVATEFAASAYARPAKLQLGLAQLGGNKVSDARRTFEAVARDDTTRANEARYWLAQCDMAEKHFDQARTTLEELLGIQPPPANVAQVALDHAVCAMELNRFQQAADELEKLRGQYAQSPQAGESAYRQAFCLHKLNKYDQSHTLCQQAATLKLAPEIAAGNAELDAENLFLLTKYADAQKQFASLAASTKDDARRLRFTMRQGQCEYFAGHFPQAVQILQPLASDPRVENSEELNQSLLLLGDALLQQKKDAEAIAPLKQFLRNARIERQQALYKLGIAQLHTNDAAGARDALTQACEGSADSPWAQRAWFERGQLDMKDKKFDQAGNEFRRAFAANVSPDVAAPAGYQLGWAEFQGKHFPEAARDWKEMAEKYPKDKLAADAVFQQGVALREAKQLNEAAEAFQAYASAHPDGQYFVKARQLAAACLKDLGKNAEAARMLADLSSVAKGSGADGVLYDLAWAQRDAKDTSSAQAAYRRLIQEHSDSKLAPAARTELAELLSDEKKYDEAAQLLEQVVSDKSADPKVLAAAEYRLGWCYEKLNKPDKAAAVYASYTQKGGGTDEMNASALLHAGLSFASDQKYDKAEQALSEMLSKYPNQKDAVVAMLRLGEVQAEQQKYDASARTYSQFMDKYPTSEFAYRARFGIAWALENQKQYEQARQTYEKVIAATNGETAARAQFQIGETWLAEGKFEQAIPALLAVEDVYKYPKWSARALFEAGRAFEQLKQPDKAKQQYGEIVNKYKDAPEAGMAQDRLKTIAGS